MKKFLSVLLFASLVLALFCPAASAELREGGYALISKPNPDTPLHLRMYGSNSSTSLGRYYNGVAVKIDALAPDGWSYVTVGGETGLVKGYVPTACLAEADAQVTPMLPSATVTAAGGVTVTLNGEQAASQVRLSQGAQVTVLGVNDFTAHVQIGGATAFIALHALSIGGAAATQAPVVSYSTAVPTPKPTLVPTAAPTATPFNGPSGYHPIAEWPFPLNPYTVQGVVNNPKSSDRLNLRAKPESGAKSLGKYYNGVRVTLLNDLSDALATGWAHVSVEGLEGYMKTKYLLIPDSGYGVTSAMPVMKVSNPNKSKNLHLRAEPSTDSYSMGLYPNGTEVILMGFTANWAHVIVDGQSGFMMTKYLK